MIDQKLKEWLIAIQNSLELSLDATKKTVDELSRSQVAPLPPDKPPYSEYSEFDVLALRQRGQIEADKVSQVVPMQFLQTKPFNRVEYITSLEDDPDNPQPGTARYALEEGDCYVVSRAQGVIELKAPIVMRRPVRYLGELEAVTGFRLAFRWAAGKALSHQAMFYFRGDNQTLRFIRMYRGRKKIDYKEKSGNAFVALKKLDGTPPNNCYISHSDIFLTADNGGSFFRARDAIIHKCAYGLPIGRLHEKGGAHDYGLIVGGYPGTKILRDSLVSGFGERSPAMMPQAGCFLRIFNNSIHNCVNGGEIYPHGGIVHFTGNAILVGPRSRSSYDMNVVPKGDMKRTLLVLAGNVGYGGRSYKLDEEHSMFDVQHHAIESGKREKHWGADRLIDINGEYISVATETLKNLITKPLDSHVAPELKAIESYMPQYEEKIMSDTEFYDRYYAYQEALGVRGDILDVTSSGYARIELVAAACVPMPDVPRLK